MVETSAWKVLATFNVKPPNDAEEFTLTNY